MARVQLYLRPAGSHDFQFIRPNRRRDTIAALRLLAYVDLMALVSPARNSANAAFPECIVDTGALLSVLPERIWSLFKPGAVTPLPFDAMMPPAQRVVSLGGGAWPYELGELSIRLRDLSGKSMDVTFVAQLIHDGGQLTSPMILGLRGGVLDGRILRSEPDATIPFGQSWVLEDS